MSFHGRKNLRLLIISRDFCKSIFLWTSPPSSLPLDGGGEGGGEHTTFSPLPSIKRGWGGVRGGKIPPPPPPPPPQGGGVLGEEGRNASSFPPLVYSKGGWGCVRGEKSPPPFPLPSREGEI